MEVIKQTAKVENIFKLGQILEVAQENVITNIDFNVAKDYIPYAVEFSTENLLTESLPGTVPDLDETNGVSIFVVDEDETALLIQQLFFPEETETQDGNTTGGNTTSATGNTTTNSNVSTTSSSSNSTSTTSKSSIKIEVLNGTNDGRNLQEVVNKLKEEGYNVSRTGTTTATSKTVIANKNAISTTTINDIQEIVGLGTISDSNTGTSSKADVTVIIGRDYDE